jgi:hypothetical protein
MIKPRLLAIGAIIVGLFGLAIRVHLLRSPAGALNADEAYTGLQAMSILNGELPVIMGGAGYTAIFDSYFFVPFVWGGPALGPPPSFILQRILALVAQA